MSYLGYGFWTGYARGLGVCKDEVKAAEKAYRDYRQAEASYNAARTGFGAAYGGTAAAIGGMILCSGPQVLACLVVGGIAVGAGATGAGAAQDAMDLADAAEDNAWDDLNSAVEEVCKCVRRHT